MGPMQKLLSSFISLFMPSCFGDRPQRRGHVLFSEGLMQMFPKGKGNKQVEDYRSKWGPCRNCYLPSFLCSCLHASETDHKEEETKIFLFITWTTTNQKAIHNFIFFQKIKPKKRRKVILISQASLSLSLCVSFLNKIV